MPVKTPYTAVLQSTLEHALHYLASVDQRSVGATATLDELRNALRRPLPEQGMPATEVLDELVADADGGLTGSASGRFFGWVVGGAVPAAVAADWLGSAWDQAGALYSTSPAAAVVEEVCGDWLKTMLNLPDTASFALVTGCQMAHSTCLAAARNEVLARHDWDVERCGLSGAPRVQVLANVQRHGSVERAARFLGLGSDAVIGLPADDRGRLQPETLEAALEKKPSGPTIVALQAGDVNTGTFDPFTELIPLAHAHNAWVHIDCAFGLWVAASPKYRHLLDGAKTADSWALDGHKWLNVPYDCGYAFTAHPSAHRAAMALHKPASYLTYDTDARDEMDWNPEWSRRARGFATYAAIRQLGRQGIAEIVERCCDCAKQIVLGIGELSGAEVVFEPIINQGMVRFLDERSGATNADHDARTDAVIQKILESGEALFSPTTWQGKRCMRVSVSSWRTAEDDVERTLAAVGRCLDT